MWKACTLWLCLFLVGCVTVPSPAERRGVADTLAAQHGWGAVMLPAGQFDLVAYLPANLPTYLPPSLDKANRLTIYLEGDGLAWITGTHLSSDPTPRDPLGLRLALAQPEGAAAYLARPCQYVETEHRQCASLYWSEQRFAPEVIAATNHAIDTLKQRFGAKRLTLVGYSGGGAVAALVAARRDDVDQLITVAGNLDHAAWTTYHRIHPLAGSLNPVDQIATLRQLRQWYWVGGKDENITPALVQDFANRFPADRRPVVRIESGFDHRCCWAAEWPRLWRAAAFE